MASQAFLDLNNERCFSMNSQMGNASAKEKRSGGRKTVKSHEVKHSFDVNPGGTSDVLANKGLPMDHQELGNSKGTVEEILAEGERSFLEEKAKRGRNLANLKYKEKGSFGNALNSAVDSPYIPKDGPSMSHGWHSDPGVMHSSALQDGADVDHTCVPQDVHGRDHSSALQDSPGMGCMSLPQDVPSEVQNHVPQDGSGVNHTRFQQGLPGEDHSSDPQAGSGTEHTSLSQDVSSVAQNHVPPGASGVNHTRVPQEVQGVYHSIDPQDGPGMGHTFLPQDVPSVDVPQNVPRVGHSSDQQDSPCMDHSNAPQNGPRVVNSGIIQNSSGMVHKVAETSDDSSRHVAGDHVFSTNAVQKSSGKAPPQEQIEYTPEAVQGNLSIPPTPHSKIESGTPSASQMVSGLHQEKNDKTGIQENDAEKSKVGSLLVSTAITDNTLLLEKLSKYLDRESRHIKFWKHLAYVLDVPAEESRKFDIYSEHSPTEAMFNYLVIWNPDLKVKELKAKLKAAYRKDVIISLEEGGYADRMEVCDLFLGDPRFIGLLSPKLDVESRSIGNWRTIAGALGIHKATSDQFGMPHHGPTAMLFGYLATSEELRSLTVGQLRGHFIDMDRKDLIQILNKRKVDDTSLVRDALKADSELLAEVGERLNRDMRAIKNWRNLAYKLEIPYEEYDSFDTSKGKAKSATKLLFEWLAKWKPLLNVEGLLKGIRAIDRADVAELVTIETNAGVTLEDAKKSEDILRISSNKCSDGSTQQLTNKASSSSIFSDLQKLQVDADNVRKKVDLSNDLKQNALNKGFIIRDNPGEGDCMLYALADQLKLVKGITVSHVDLRIKLVEFLETNPKLADGTDLSHFVSRYPSWTAYLQAVKRGGTWGDHVVLFAAANFYKAPIRVVSSLPDREDIFIYPEPSVCMASLLVLGHVHEQHYVSLHPKPGVGSASAPIGSIANNGHRPSAPNHVTSTQTDQVTFTTAYPRCDLYVGQPSQCIPRKEPGTYKTSEVPLQKYDDAQQYTVEQRLQECRIDQAKEQRIAQQVRNLPYRFYSKLCTKLDIKRDFFDDFRMLAEDLGIERDTIRLLEQNKNPTHSIFTSYTQTVTVGMLIQALHRIQRFDVAELLEDWVQGKHTA